MNAYSLSSACLITFGLAYELFAGKHHAALIFVLAAIAQAINGVVDRMKGGER